VKIVFWYDAKRELRDEFEAVSLPDDADNWLLDVQMAYGELRTDQTAIRLSEAVCTGSEPRMDAVVENLLDGITTEDTEDTEMGKLKYEEESYRIRGAIFEVYREMGCGFLEAVYQECLEKELRKAGVPFVAQQELVLYYKGEALNQTYKPDVICFGKIIVELKAVKELCNEHRAQVHNYLKASGHELGFLVNFGHYPKVEIERIAF